MTPLCVNDVAMCPHNGKVEWSASHTEFELKGQPALVSNDVLAPISGCTRVNESGVPDPCTEVVSASTDASKVHIKGEPVALAEKVSTGITDKGFPIALQGAPHATGVADFQ